MTLIPYLAAMVLACLAGALNPSGLRTMLTAGLPAAAAFGLTQMDRLVVGAPPRAEIQPMQRGFAWIAIAAIVSILFVVALGPGVRFS